MDAQTLSVLGGIIAAVAAAGVVLKLTWSRKAKQVTKAKGGSVSIGGNVRGDVTYKSKD